MGLRVLSEHQQEHVRALPFVWVLFGWILCGVKRSLTRSSRYCVGKKAHVAGSAACPPPP